MALVGAHHQRKIGGGGFQPELPSLLEAIHVDGEEAFALLLYAGGVAHLKHFILRLCVAFLAASGSER